MAGATRIQASFNSANFGYPAAMKSRLPSPKGFSKELLFEGIRWHQGWVYLRVSV
jgi:hypothetical protein